MLTKIVTTTLLVITGIKLCYSEYASTKLSLAPPYPSYNIIEPDGPGTYAFGYEIDDAASGNKQFRNEERLRNGTVQGSYGSVLPDGTISITKYVADENGYRSKIENKQPRPIGENVLDNHQRPSSSASPEISPDLAALILSQKKPTKPIQPTKTEVKPQPVLPTPMSSLSQQKQVFSFSFPNFFEPQPKPPASHKPMNQPIQAINDRFHSPIYESNTQENAAFFQNSKLHKFFHSPHYIQNIYGKYVMDPDEMSDDDMANEMIVVEEEPIVGMASPLTKEALWYKDHDLEPRGITDELSDDSLAEVLYDFRSKNHRSDLGSDEESDDDDDDEEDDDGDWERDDGIEEPWEDDSDYDHVKYVKEVGEWKEVEHREYEDDDFEEFEEDQWVEDTQDGKWAEVEEEVEDEGADEDEWEEFDNDDDDEDEYNIGDGSEDEDWEEWSEER